MTTDSTAVATLLACGVAVLRSEPEGATTIPENSILVRIPRGSVLSVKSSPVAARIPPHPYGRGAQLSLSLALSVELVKRTASPWHGYLQSLPREIPGMPLFWTRGGAQVHEGQHKPDLGNSDPMEWLRGTEAAKILWDSGEDNPGLFVNSQVAYLRFRQIDHVHPMQREINEYYRDTAQPLYAQVFASSPECTIPTLHDFYYAYALVSSRSFLVDAHHGLAMVPIADAFNHAQDNHVHLESDFDVCPECGSLEQCSHDDATPDPIPRATDIEHCFEMVANRDIPPDSEVFNTYGEALCNAQLLIQYGFILDANENDHITWTLAELAQFTEDYYTPSFTWDSVGGVPHFQRLLGDVRALAWDGVARSELVYHDAARAFTLNGDAQLSHGLWLYFALLVYLRRANTADLNSENAGDTRHAVVMALKDILECQLALEAGEPVSHGGAAPYGLMLDLARIVAALCRHRAARTGKAGVGTAELGDILDVRVVSPSCVYHILFVTFFSALQSLPEAMTPTRMGISLALTDRSLLDSCISAWEGIQDFLI
ncbi:hypothetical protein B0H10DRAFT_2431791 [Mycena sp. CBHHK59/15]|nr:hypothetical protein B0H10DRAFT_2431791 [Mycena sp. CBHHK59/15]